MIATANASDPREPVSPEFDRGWNAAMSYAENYLVMCAMHAPRHPGPTSRPIQRALLIVADRVGAVRKPTKRSFG